MENKNLANFKKLVSDKKSNYFDQEVDKEKRLICARVVFKMLDFMDTSSPKITQVKFADKINVSPQYMSKLLKGKENLTIETMQKIAKAMDLKLHELLLPEEPINSGVELVCRQVELDPKDLSLYLKLDSVKKNLMNVDESAYNQELSYSA